MTANVERIVVTGATGFLGRHLMPVLRARYPTSVILGTNSVDFDLTSLDDAREMFQRLRPTTLVHLAAYSGGLGANRAYAADFYYRNTQMTTAVFQAAYEHMDAGFSRLLCFMGGCSYPVTARNPIDEEQMWDGYPHPDSAPYSLAKRSVLVASDAYRRQYGLQSTVLLPGNMYGQYDNFSLSDGHVIPVLMRRMHEAKLAQTSAIPVWGTGRVQRDFVYAGDVAAVIPYFISSKECHHGPINISSGIVTSIADLVAALKTTVGFTGDVAWEPHQPEGQLVKVFDVRKLHSLGLSCPTELRAGLERTYAWFSSLYRDKSHPLRL